MSAKSGAQQKAAGAALAAKRAKASKRTLKGASRSMYESMSEDQLDGLASTKQRGKPEHVGAAKTTRKAAKKSGVKKRAQKTVTEKSARKAPRKIPAGRKSGRKAAAKRG